MFAEVSGVAGNIGSGDTGGVYSVAT